MANVKERLRRTELDCSRFEEQYKKYRLRGLEETYCAKILEQYSPNGISTISPGQITWDTPSPIQCMSDMCLPSIN